MTTTATTERPPAKSRRTPGRPKIQRQATEPPTPRHRTAGSASHDRPESEKPVPVRPDVPAAAPRPAKPQSQKPALRWGILSALIVLIVVVGSAAVFAVGIYKLGWQGRWVDRVVAWVPFPAATTSGSLITYHEYQEDLQALRSYFASNQAAGGEQPTPTLDEMSATVLNRLIYDQVVERLVRTYNVDISDAELEEQLNAIAESRGSRDEIASLLRSLYGWDEAQFKNKVLRPYIALQKLDDLLTENGTLAGDAGQRATDVLAKANTAGQSFEELAKTYSEDGTASAGGDLGYFGKGVMDPDFEAAVDALKPGELSGVVRTQFGYHIIQLVERLEDPDKGVQYHARHILIATKSIDDFVNEKIALQKVRLFLGGFTWDADKHWVVPKSVSQPG